MALIPQNSFYTARTDPVNDESGGNIGISTLSYDIRDVRFIRKLISAKVVLKKLKFVKNSRFLVGKIVHKKPLVKIKRLNLVCNVVKSDVSENAKPPEVKGNTTSTVDGLLSNELSRSKVIVTVVFPDDGNIDWVQDQEVPASSTLPRLSVPPLSYLRPSQSEDNYGLGTQEEIMRDNEERPHKVVPEWAEEDRVSDQMRRQARIDADKIFALRVCNVSELDLIFPNNKNIPLETPSPCFKVPKKPKKVRGKENKSKATRRLHYNFS